MALYTCEKCGMSIGEMTCGQCGKQLEHNTIQADDGRDIHVSECPDGHGKVKSPMCCGQDMTRNTQCLVLRDKKAAFEAAFFMPIEF